MQDFTNFSLVPDNYKKQDPRVLAYFYPKTLNVVAFAKKMQEFTFYQALEVAEDIAKKTGYILVPWKCVHWKRARLYGNNRKIKIGRHSFFLLRENELTANEKKKLLNFLSNETQNAI